MFRFFEEVKEGFSNEDMNLSYHVVNIGGKLVYVEGHMGLIALGTEVISLKVKKGVLTIEGKHLSLKELTENTVKIQGEISRVEAF